MLLCYRVTRKSYFPRDLFVSTLNECFVTPERLYFSVASSQNQSTFKKEKKKREVNIICNVKQLPRGILLKSCSENFWENTRGRVLFW